MSYKSDSTNLVEFRIFCRFRGAAMDRESCSSGHREENYEKLIFFDGLAIQSGGGYNLNLFVTLIDLGKRAGCDTRR